MRARLGPNPCFALPAPGAKKAWNEVFGIAAHTPTNEVEKAARAARSATHPDRPGGSHDCMVEVNRAWDEFQAERGTFLSPSLSVNEREPIACFAKTSGGSVDSRKAMPTNQKSQASEKDSDVIWKFISHHDAIHQESVRGIRADNVASEDRPTRQLMQDRSLMNGSVPAIDDVRSQVSFPDRQEAVLTHLSARVIEINQNVFELDEKVRQQRLKKSRRAILQSELVEVKARLEIGRMHCVRLHRSHSSCPCSHLALLVSAQDRRSLVDAALIASIAAVSPS